MIYGMNYHDAERQVREKLNKGPANKYLNMDVDPQLISTVRLALNKMAEQLLDEIESLRNKFEDDVAQVKGLLGELVSVHKLLLSKIQEQREKVQAMMVNTDRTDMIYCTILFVRCTEAYTDNSRLCTAFIQCLFNTRFQAPLRIFTYVIVLLVFLTSSISFIY